MDRYGDRTIYDVDFVPVTDAGPARGAGLVLIDHLTHNVSRGHMDKWAGFYERLFNFRELRYFDIEGKKTGLFSRAMTSPCGKIRIPINESRYDKSQIEEYLREYRGEGIQRIALATNDIYATVDVLRAQGVEFQDTPDAYYDGVEARVAGHRESLKELKQRRILIDGNAREGIHHQHLPDSLYVERGRFSDSTLQGLERRGHRLKVIGRSGCAPTIVRVDGMWQGVSDVRCGGLARGF